MTTAFTYQGPDRFHGVPARDITDAEYEAMGADLKRIVLQSPAYQPVLDESEQDDPLKTLTNEQYAELAPAEKAARTREVKKRADESGEGSE